MSLEEIRKSIDSDARARARTISEEGEAEAAEIVKAARLSASELLKAAQAEAAREAERIAKEKVSEAQIEVNSMTVAAKESVLERYAGPLRRGISSQLSGKKLDRILSGAAKEFVRFSSKGEMVVRTGKRNAAFVRKLGYSAVQGGEGELSVASRDGSVSIDASPDGITEMYLPRARALLAARLWKERVKK